MIAAEQIRAARALAGWSQGDLAERAGVSVPAIANIELEKQRPGEQTLNKLETAFRDAEIEFIDGGVRRSQNLVRVIEGEDCYLRVLDDVFYTLSAGDELLIAPSDDRVSSVAVNDSYRRLRGAGIKMRQLIEDGNTYLMGDVNEYRYLPRAYFHNNVIIIYGDKVGSIIQGTKGSANENKKKILVTRDKGLSESLRNLFNFIWSITEKPKASTADEKF